MRFVYPSLPYQTRTPDPLWAPEYAWARAHGLAAGLVDLDAGKLWFATPTVADEPAVYRGWMLTAAEYETLGQLLPLAVPLAAYLASHEAPGWYGAVADYTFPSRFVAGPETPDFAAGRRYFVKGLVKSFGADSVVSDPVQFAALRGTHGLAPEAPLFVREFVELKPDSERRFFVVRGVAYGACGAGLPAALGGALARLEPRLFYALDAAETISGRLVVVEIGDGQVSDLKEWAVPKFGETVLRALAAAAGEPE